MKFISEKHQAFRGDGGKLASHCLAYESFEGKIRAAANDPGCVGRPKLGCRP